MFAQNITATSWLVADGEGNTNPLVATHDFIISKTGYIHASGGCIVMMLNSKNTRTRIKEAYQLAIKN